LLSFLFSQTLTTITRCSVQYFCTFVFNYLVVWAVRHTQNQTSIRYRHRGMVTLKFRVLQSSGKIKMGNGNWQLRSPLPLLHGGIAGDNCP
jgi:hypothetical protein